jgi:hypothetical protein
MAAKANIAKSAANNINFFNTYLLFGVTFVDRSCTAGGTKPHWSRRRILQKEDFRRPKV